MHMSLSRCFEIPRPKPAAAIRLFCFHHAGGGGSLFRPWANALSSHAELVLVQLPGREHRRDEQLHDTHAAAVDELMQAIQPLLDKPCVFFGHSMGALLALGLAQRLQGAGQGGVLKKVFFSACHPPHLPRPVISTLPDADFLSALAAMGGTPDNVLNDADLMSLFLPVLRADFAICESSGGCARGNHERLQALANPEAPGSVLACPVQAWGGMDDAIGLDDLASWRRYGRGEFQMKLFAGGHFYIKTHRAHVLKNLLIDL